MKPIGVIVLVFVILLSLAIFSFRNPFLYSLLHRNQSTSTEPGNGSSSPTLPPTAPGTFPEPSSTPPEPPPAPVLLPPTQPSSSLQPTPPVPTPKPAPAPSPVAPAPKPAPAPPPPDPRAEFLKNLDPNDIPPGLKASDLSIYFQKIRIGYVTPADPDDAGGYDQVSLTTDFAAEDSYNISGWSVRSNRSIRNIGRGVATIDPAVSPVPKDIYVRMGQTIALYSGSSALGVNFRLNKCIGYLESELNFTPELPLECPVPDQYDIYTFTGACQDYLTSLNTCEVPQSSENVPADDYACKQFLSELNYSGCFKNHRKDSDFFGNGWWLWVGQRFLDPLHDRVQILDRQGLVVDQYVY